MRWIVTLCRLHAEMAIFPSCQIKELPFIYHEIPPDWLIAWYKGSPGHCAYVGFNDWEPHLVYGRRKDIHMHDYFHTSTAVSYKGHTCPKPTAWARWLISRASHPSDLILDPFMGSGTTLRAAKDLGRRAIGIDIDEGYCRLAVGRMAQGTLSFGRTL